MNTKREPDRGPLPGTATDTMDINALPVSGHVTVTMSLEAAQTLLSIIGYSNCGIIDGETPLGPLYEALSENLTHFEDRPRLRIDHF